MEFHYEVGGAVYPVTLEPVGADGFRVAIGDRVYQVHMQASQPGRIDFTVDGSRYSAAVAQEGQRGRVYVAVGGREVRHYELTPVFPQTQARRRSGAQGGNLDAPLHGRVVQVLVKEGDQVENGQSLLVLEAMKMETRIVAPLAGTVTRLSAQAGEMVERGERLVEITAA
jgi:biotin carboxyl carrier protein